jgi:hypothetical protein
MDILSRQRKSHHISTQFKFAIEFKENDQLLSVEVIARTAKKALNIFRKHYPGEVKVVKVYSPKERKRYAPKLQKTFATTEAKRITDEIFGSNESST